MVGSFLCGDRHCRFALRNELTGTIYGSSPCLLQNPRFLFSSSDSVAIQSSVTFSNGVLASLTLAGIETHLQHTRTPFLVQQQRTLHVHMYELSYTNLSMVLLNI